MFRLPAVGGTLCRDASAQPGNGRASSVDFRNQLP
jgi:hypothetical protein